MVSYLLDANVFMEAKNRYYDLDVFPCFWEWLDQTQKNKKIASIEAVYEELIQGKATIKAKKKDQDMLITWAEDHKNDGWFLKNDDSKVQQVYRQIAQFVQEGDYKERAKSKFLDGADPWLIAKAKVIRATVVTQEKLDKNAKKRVLIPNICEQFDVDCIDTFELLKNLGATFK